jgi:hypothetical protein
MPLSALSFENTVKVLVVELYLIHDVSDTGLRDSKVRLVGLKDGMVFVMNKNASTVLVSSGVLCKASGSS